LDTVLSQYTMGPIRHTANNLNPARLLGSRMVETTVAIFAFFFLSGNSMPVLFILLPNRLPLIEMRVA